MAKECSTMDSLLGSPKQAEESPLGHVHPTHFLAPPKRPKNPPLGSSSSSSEEDTGRLAATTGAGFGAGFGATTTGLGAGLGAMNTTGLGAGLGATRKPVPGGRGALTGLAGAAL